MISISPTAAERIRMAARESGADTPVLRVAVRRLDDGTLDYGMGFDQSRPGDVSLEIDGIVVVVARQSQDLVAGTHIDFVEIEPGDFRFIFSMTDSTPAP
jgi:iron-sulfur cluster assembly protein